MKDVSLIIVGSECGDWSGLYVDGILETEGHNLYERDWVDVIRKYKTFTGDIKSYEVSDEYIGERGSFPKKFVEIPNEYFTLC